MSARVAPRLRVVDVAFYERPVTLRLPFRFGVVTLTEAPQTFVRARIRLASGHEATGFAAEMLAPKWFDKDLALSNEQNFEQLRTALGTAAELYLQADSDMTAFALHAECADQHYRACAGRALNSLVAGFGTALLDRAILDGLCRSAASSVFEAVRSNLPGLGAQTARDLEGFDIDAFLACLRPARSIHARHTVGLVDAIAEADVDAETRVDDGLPESLEACVARYRHGYFKLKAGGDAKADIDRLLRIAAVLDSAPEPYWATLDGNEQYPDAESVIDLWRRIEETPRLKRLADSIMFIEQPIVRASALEEPIHPLAALKPVEIDESDSDINAFPRARRLGYTGISSKSCKGFYRSLLNAARVAKWNEEDSATAYFMSAEDLTTQAGVAVQQDLTLATLIGCTHVERNGHHYADGMAGAPPAEQAAFVAAHPDIYCDASGHARVRIEGGQMRIGSLDTPGIGCAVEPYWSALTPMQYKSAVA